MGVCGGGGIAKAQTIKKMGERDYNTIREFCSVKDTLEQVPR